MTDVVVTFEDHRGYVARLSDGSTIAALSLAGLRQLRRRGLCWTSAPDTSAPRVCVAAMAARRSGAGDEHGLFAAARAGMLVMSLSRLVGRGLFSSQYQKLQSRPAPSRSGFLFFTRGEHRPPPPR
jgi:hypothetical protein